jgi:thymidylate kinase
MAKPRACTIAFVGVDGSGKSTVMARLAAWLRDNDVAVHEVKVRSGRSGLDRQATEQGHDGLRDVVGADTALMMLAAVTWQSVRDTKPLRRDPDCVLLLDRSTHCVLALGSLDAPDAVPLAARLFEPLPRPDVVVHVRVDAEVAVERLSARGGTPQTSAFLAAFDRAYRALPDAADFLEVDGNRSPDEVFEAVRAALMARLGDRIMPTPRAPGAGTGAQPTRSSASRRRR